jgi:hypothetical protein
MSEALQRLDELLLNEAMGPLGASEQAELELLLNEHRSVDRYAYERAASTFFLAVCAESIEPMPETLGSKLRLAAAQALEASDG